MICKVCNTDNAPGTMYCENCGATLEQETVVTESYNSDVPATDPGKTLSLVSLILGIAALNIISLISGIASVALSFVCTCFSCGGILPSALGVLAIILGAIGMGKSKNAGFNNKMGMIGLILGIAGVVLVAVISIVFAVIGGVGAIMGEAGSY